MQVGWLRRHTGYLLGAGLLLAVVSRTAAWGDDSGFLGRLFRLGGNSSSPNSSSAAGGQPAPLSYGPPGNFVPPAGSPAGAPAPLTTFGGLPETPGLSSPASPAQRLTPKSRASSAVTSADPVVTRLALGRSNDGSQFGMFLQVFADGTVIDSEGVHHVRLADLKPILDAVQSGELYRVRGHCGAPSTDFIEYVHVVVYEHRFGRLMAHAFSYSGNPQGCDHVIRHLHTALENLQAKLSHHPVVQPTGAVPISPGTLYGSPTATPANRLDPAPGVPFGHDRQPAGTPSGPVIPLTPAEPGR
jgi:hypothetical protein